MLYILWVWIYHYNLQKYFMFKWCLRYPLEIFKESLAAIGCKSSTLHYSIKKFHCTEVFVPENLWSPLEEILVIKRNPWLDDSIRRDGADYFEGTLGVFVYLLWWVSLWPPQVTGKRTKASSLPGYTPGSWNENASR